MRKGFTLIELMIVVAIIGILAAIAIPSFLAMQLRAKRSELPTNLDAIRTAEKAYHAEWDTYTACGVAPSAQPTRQAVPFNTGAVNAFSQMGWAADGNVRGQYSVTITTSGNLALDNFEGVATGNIDGNDDISRYSCTKDLKPNMTSDNNVY